LLCHRHDGRRAGVAQYHNRMPVVLDDSQFDDWMRGTPDQAVKMMKPYTGAIKPGRSGPRSAT
jgi:putative SOS response-associated peptidase YedK